MRDISVLLKIQAYYRVVAIEEISMEKSGFTCLVRASGHRASESLMTPSRQVDKAEFVCTEYWGF